MNDILVHHGILGQKWGVRRFQNEDGTLTKAGKERYGVGDSKIAYDVNREKYIDNYNSIFNGLKEAYKNSLIREPVNKLSKERDSQFIQKYGKLEKDAFFDLVETLNTANRYRLGSQVIARNFDGYLKTVGIDLKGEPATAVSLQLITDLMNMQGGRTEFDPVKYSEMTELAMQFIAADQASKMVDSTIGITDEDRDLREQEKKANKKLEEAGLSGIFHVTPYSYKGVWFVFAEYIPPGTKMNTDGTPVDSVLFNVNDIDGMKKYALENGLFEKDDYRVRQNTSTRNKNIDASGGAKTVTKRESINVSDTERSEKQAASKSAEEARTSKNKELLDQVLKAQARTRAAIKQDEAKKEEEKKLKHSEIEANTKQNEFNPIRRSRMKFDFSGYATKNNLRCTDGVTIRNGAFKECDGDIVPLVWQHLHDDPSNVLGKAFLEHREDGVYAYCQFNNTEKAQNARELVAHGDINSMSIYATKVVKNGNNVTHGSIKEVSLVLAPANPGAKIESLSIAHGDGTFSELEDEFVIRHSGEIDEYAAFDLEVDLYDQDGSLLTHAEEENNSKNDETVEEVFNTLSDKQKNAVYYIISQVIADNTTTVKQSDEGGTDMNYNAFEQNGSGPAVQTLTHADIEKVATMTFDECKRGTNFKTALQHAAATYGIQDIETLFPDAKDLNSRPEFVKRRTEWVNTVLSGTKHTPFSRIRSRFADITADEARARGYIKGNKKVEEVFPVMQRSTTPQTIYKLQKLDRDDILDITDFDVVAWLRAEMRVMLDEEIARAVLIGDGREVSSPDKIKEEHIRPIWTDDDFYAYKLRLSKSTGDSNKDLNDLADAFIRSRLYYEGAGRPVAFLSPETVTELMLQRDADGYRLYKTETELADALRVSKLIEVPLFYGKVREGKTNVPEENGKFFALNAIIVNLSDYTMGADKGGQVSNFDDFDIDYNQYKYLIETRLSGALTGYHSAVIIETESDGPAARSISSTSRKISV